jgi:hypothetical protein
VAIAGIGVATHHGKHASARAAIAAPKRHLTVLAPTPPTPCYLLIADRGNGRMLPVDSAKHVFWRYRFDDDTFLGPARDRIVSNRWPGEWQPGERRPRARRVLGPLRDVDEDRIRRRQLRANVESEGLADDGRQVVLANVEVPVPIDARHVCDATEA